MTLTFARSRAPRVEMGTGELPAAARACILESARTLRVERAPRGVVSVQAHYAVTLRTFGHSRWGGSR